MSDIDPDLVPEAWDAALIGPTFTPGICKISQGGREIKWDTKPAFGTALPVTKLTGIEASTFEMRIDFYEGVLGLTGAEQRTRWEQEILPLLAAAENGKSAVEFFHPAVSLPPCNITAIIPQKIGILEQADDGHWFVVCKLGQFGKPKPAVGAPKGGKKSGSNVGDENSAKIDALTKQLKDLAG